jgi:hypothetical protein
MGFQLSQWSDKWDLFVKWLALTWDKVEARPYGLLSVLWESMSILSDWVRGNADVGVLIALIVVALVTRRVLGRRH